MINTLGKLSLTCVPVTRFLTESSEGSCYVKLCSVSHCVNMANIYPEKNCIYFALQYTINNKICYYILFTWPQILFGFMKSVTELEIDYCHFLSKELPWRLEFFVSLNTT